MEKSLIYLYLIRRRNLLAGLSALIVLVACLGMGGLGFESAYKNVVSRENPYLKSLEVMEDKYYPSNYLLIYIASNQGTVVDEKGLNFVREATRRAETLPFSQRINSVANFQHITAKDDELTITPMIEGAVSGKEAEVIKQRILAEKMLVNRLIDAEGKASIIYATIELPKDNHTKSILELWDKLFAYRSELKKAFPEYTLYFGGSIMVEAEMIQSAKRDGSYTVPLMMLFGFLIQLFLFRSYKPYIGTFMVINAATTAALGVCGWIYLELTVISSLASLLIVTISTANTIHISANYITYLNAGHLKEEAMYLSFKDNLIPLIVTSITTCVGFSGLNFSDNPQFAVMGNIAIVGTLFSMLFTITVYPASMLAFKFAADDKQLRLNSFVEHIADLVLRHHKAFLAIGLLVTFFSTVAIFKNSLNDDPLRYFAEGTELRKATDFSKTFLPGIRQVTVDLKPRNGNINDPQFLQEIDQFVSWLETQNSVEHVFSYSDLLKKINKLMHDNDTSAYAIPRSSEEASQYLLLYEMSLPFGQDIHDFVDRKRESLRLEVLLKNELDNAGILEKTESFKHYAALNIRSAEIDISSIDLMFALNGQRVLEGLIDGAWSSIFLVTLVVAMALKSVRFGLLSILPNIAPPLVVYGIWGLLVGEVIMSTATTFTICLGIIIDDTLYILVKYLRARKMGNNVESAVRYALLNAGPAVIVTSLIFSSGAALLFFSNFLPIAVIGYVMTPIILLALVFDLMVLPGIIILVERLFGAKEAEQSPVSIETSAT